MLLNILFQILLFCLFLLYLKYLKNYVSKNWKRIEPPGPFQLPIIGNLVQLFRAHPTLPHLALFKLSKKYGEIMSVKFGSINGVVLSSHEAMSKVLSKDECTSRYKYIYHQYRIPGFDNLGVLLSSGESWSETRRFTIKNLRNVGYGKVNSFETLISKTVDDLSAKLCSEVEKSSIVEFDNYFGVSIVSLIWSYMFGVVVGPDDPLIKRHCNLANKLTKAVKIDNIAILFPLISKLFPKWTGMEELKIIFKEQKDFYMENIEEKRRKLLNENDKNSFIGSFLNQIESEKSHPIFTMENLVVTIADLFTAGSDTTSNYLSYSILLMIHYPDVQKKIYEEIKNATQTNAQITLSHMKKMPYTEATLLEIHRVSTIVPSILPRQATQDIIYKEYTIPKNSLVTTNMYAVFNDEEYWGDPAVFRPERFLDSKNSVKSDFLKGQVFGYGKRICPGESLSKASSFLYFTNFIQKFEFHRIKNESLPSLDPIPSFTLGPYPFKCTVNIR